jgi:hypothetical protein
MVLSWFDAKEANRFGESLAGYFAERLPAASRLTDKKFAAKAQQALSSMARQVDEFKRAHKLNVYKKAQLGNAFKWKLRDAGYDAAYVDELTEWLMVRF